jgi:hypothetical protein
VDSAEPTASSQTSTAVESPPSRQSPREPSGEFGCIRRIVPEHAPRLGRARFELKWASPLPHRRGLHSWGRLLRDVASSPGRRRPCSGPRDFWQQELRGLRGAARVAAVTGSYRLGPVAEGRPRWCSLSAHLTRQNQPSADPGLAHGWSLSRAPNRRPIGGTVPSAPKYRAY